MAFITKNGPKLGTPIDINKTEDTLFEEVKIESSKASNIYIFTFFILLFSTIVIILADVRSNRGSDD